MNIIMIGIGGFIGAILRFLVAGGIQKLAAGWDFPLGTIIVNITGCFIMGVLAGLADNFGVLSPPLRSFLLVGMLGAFTTLSSFSYETLNLMHDREFIIAGVYVILTFAVSLFSTWIGYSISLLKN